MAKKESCIFYADWMEAAQMIEDPVKRCQFYEACLRYGLKRETMELAPDLKLVFALVKNQIDRDNTRYEDISEKRKAAVEARYKAKKQQQEGTTEVQEPPVEQCSDGHTKDTKNTNVDFVKTPIQTVQNTQKQNLCYDNDNDNDNDLNSPPTPPQGDEAGAAGDGAFNFSRFFNQVREVARKVPPMVEQTNYTTQYVWRMAEGNPGYGTAVAKAAKEAAGPTEFTSRIQAINQRYKPSSDFTAVKLALAMLKLTATQQRDVLFEANRAAGEAGLWETLLAKVEYINNGNKILNMPGFMKSR